MTNRRCAAAALAVAALAMAALATACGSAVSEPTPGRQAPATMIILGADQFGAVILDGRNLTYRGVTRDGRVMWEDAATARDAGIVSCLARCPDAAISSSLKSLNSPVAADPPPQLVIGGRMQPLATTADHKRYVLTARGPDQYVLGVGSPTTGWWLESHSPQGMALRVRVDGPRTSWQESADGRRALAITTSEAGRRDARWFHRTDDRWLPAGPTYPIAGFTSCVSPDGTQAVLLAQAPAILDHSGIQRSLSDLVSGSACAFASEGGIVAEFAQTFGRGEAGLRTRLRGFDPGGAQLWARDLTTSATITGDPIAPRVAYVASGTLYELDLRTGAELRTASGVLAARYAGNGDIVTVDVDATVRWLPPA